jgi:hypothetical protein
MVGFWGGLSPWLVDGCLLAVCPRGLSFTCANGGRERERERERESRFVSVFIKISILYNWDHDLMSSFHLNYLLKVPFLNTVTLKIKTYNLEGWHRLIYRKR